MENDFIELGKKLRVYRKSRLLLTQEQLAEKLKIAQENISKSENGVLNPNNLIEKISKTFNIEKEDILNLDTDKSINFYGNIETNNVISSINTVSILNYHEVENTSLVEIKTTLQELVKCVDYLIKKDKV